MSTTNIEESTITAEAVDTNRWYLSSAPIIRALVHLCVPMAAAMIVGAVYNVINAGFIGSLHDSATGLVTSLFQATGRAVPAIVMSMAQGVVFIPIVFLGNLWFGLAGIIWSLTVSESIVFGVGVVMWLASRRAIDRGVAEGSPERAEGVLQQAD